MRIYAFDVDDTLEIVGGPVKIESVLELRAQGHIVGTCGNFEPVKNAGLYPRPFQFMWEMNVSKELFLTFVRQSIKAEDYVMVGNVFGVSGGSDDQGAAERTGWRFICESDFASGVR